MKILFLLPFLLCSAALPAQTELTHTPMKRERFYRAFTYADGSFSVFTSTKPAYAGRGMLTSYDSQGKSLSEQENLSITGKRWNSYIGEFEVLVNAETKSVCFLGNTRNGIILRKLTFEGKLEEVVVGRFATPLLKNTIRICGATWTDPHTLTAVFCTNNTQYKGAEVIQFNTRNLTYTVGNISESHGSFAHAGFIGMRAGRLLFVRESANADAELLAVNPLGNVQKSQLDLEEKLSSRAARFARSVVSEHPTDLLHFSVKCDMGQHYTLYRLSQDTLIGYIDWVPDPRLLALERELPKKWAIQPLTHTAVPQDPIATFYLLGSGERQELVYTSEGRNLARAIPDWDNHRTSAFDPAGYRGPINVHCLEDVRLYAEGHPELQRVQSQIGECLEDNSSCLLDVYGLLRADGHIGLLIISGYKKNERADPYATTTGEVLHYYRYQNVKLILYP